MRNLLLAALLAFVPIGATPATSTTAPGFSVADVTCPEAGPCAVTVRKSAAAKSWSRVTLTTLDGTARAPGDYAATNVTLTFGNSQLAQTVAIAIVNDNAVEGNEAFTVRLAGVRNAAIARAAATVTIADDDVAPPPSAAWVPASLQAGGYARCKTVGGCHSIGVPYPPIIAQPGDVLLQKWNGVAADNRQNIALYPIGQWMIAGVGLEGYADEWEGVAPGP